MKASGTIMIFDLGVDTFCVLNFEVDVGRRGSCGSLQENEKMDLLLLILVMILLATTNIKYCSCSIMIKVAYLYGSSAGNMRVVIETYLFFTLLLVQILETCDIGRGQEVMHHLLIHCKQKALIWVIEKAEYSTPIAVPTAAVMGKEMIHISIAVIGHVDSGKSNITGTSQDDYVVLSFYLGGCIFEVLVFDNITHKVTVEIMFHFEPVVCIMPHYLLPSMGARKLQDAAIEIMVSSGDLTTKLKARSVRFRYARGLYFYSDRSMCIEMNDLGGVIWISDEKFIKAKVLTFGPCGQGPQIGGSNVVNTESGNRGKGELLIAD